MALKELTPLENALKEAGVGYVSAIEGTVPSLSIEGSVLKWSLPSSSPEGGVLNFERVLTDEQIKLIADKL
jgi:hypothetical protein